ncbi:hypothetical protein PABY_18260 [Pyrodictium abyssi]|uniref:Uncharacterized protein n=1 Tax=Pyrodictium abyssi TaxID=54256 RepID=A0ABM8IZN9_9CREN|nr:hypothetical protein PABY_18260 [Pyrodictium abyssi]
MRSDKRVGSHQGRHSRLVQDYDLVSEVEDEPRMHVALGYEGYDPAYALVRVDSWLLHAPSHPGAPGDPITIRVARCYILGAG